MIEILLISGWTIAALIAGWLGPVRWNSRFRVYALILLSCIYLCGLFTLFPLMRKVLDLP